MLNFALFYYGLSLCGWALWTLYRIATGGDVDMRLLGIIAALVLSVVSLKLSNQA